MVHNVTSKEVADQFSIAIQLLLEWLDQRGYSRNLIDDKRVREMPVEPRLLTATEVARILKISKSNVYQLIQRNEIHTIRINRSVRVRQDDLEDFISNNRV